MLSSRLRLGIAESSFPRKFRLSVDQYSSELRDMLRPKLALDDCEPGLTLCNSWQLAEYVSSELRRTPHSKLRTSRFQILLSYTV